MSDRAVSLETGISPQFSSSDTTEAAEYSFSEEVCWFGDMIIKKFVL